MLYYYTTSWWRHQMETFSALLAICAGNSPVPGEFPAQRPVTRSFDVYFDLRPNKGLSKQSRGWWFETLSCSLWRHRNDNGIHDVLFYISYNLHFTTKYVHTSKYHLYKHHKINLEHDASLLSNLFQQTIFQAKDIVTWTRGAPLKYGNG